MRTWLSASLALACSIGVAQPPPVADVTGEIRYLKYGVEARGRTVAWKDLRSIEDVPPAADALNAEFAERQRQRPKEVVAHVRLGTWARERGLAAEATAEFEAALAIDPENGAARRALGWVRVEKEWKRTEDLLAERLRALQPDTTKGRLDLAKWCGENGCPDGEWRLLVGVAVANPRDKGMIAQMKPLVARRRQHTALLAPLSGRWLAVVDRTKHHQAKVYAMEAIDFRKVDADGSTWTGSGKKLEDHYSFDCVIRACADGVVTDVEDGYDDMPPGVAGKYDEANGVDIEHDASESTEYGHIRKGSALVKKGEKVRAGQPIARVGNSGASGVPHLHFSLSTPVADDAGNGEWIGVPWRLRGFRVVDVGGKPCDFEARVARVCEGWTVLFPELP